MVYGPQNGTQRLTSNEKRRQKSSGYASNEPKSKSPKIFGEGGDDKNWPPLKPISPEVWEAYGHVTGQKGKGK